MLYGLNSPARDARHRAENGYPRWRTDASRALLAVVLENLVAGRADLGPMFLEARQNGEVALVDDRAAVLLDVAGTGLLLVCRSAALLLLGEGPGRSRERQQGECEEKFTHRIPSFQQQESSSPICDEARRNGFCLDGRRRVTQRRAYDKHGK